MCIYPDQVGIVNDVFTPSAEEIARAKKFVAAFQEAERAGLASIQVDGRFIVVYNVQDTLYAIEDDCTHDGNPLSDGAVEGTEVICARHGARFCLRTGAALSPPAYEPVATFVVETRDGRLRIATS